MAEVSKAPKATISVAIYGGGAEYERELSEVLPARIGNKVRELIMGIPHELIAANLYVTVRVGDGPISTLIADLPSTGDRRVRLSVAIPIVKGEEEYDGFRVSTQSTIPPVNADPEHLGARVIITETCVGAIRAHLGYLYSAAPRV